MTQKITTVFALAIICLLAFGCQTYVNIPPQQTDQASHDPNGKTVRTVVTKAVRYAIDEAGITEPVQIMLPANTEKLTYANVLQNLGDQAVSPFDEEAQDYVGIVFAKGVRIRGNQGEVDIARPVGDGVDQLVTVYLDWQPLKGWEAFRLHVWRGVPVDESTTRFQSN
tara:strand:- start:461 stop:964 length:504 start_codon:yes stop_codon:yes gene_type:complete